MTEKVFDAKWNGVDKETLEYEQMKEFIEDRFSLYEETGFLETFDSLYDDNGEHNGMRFEVVRRGKEYDGTDEGEVDLEAMPVWLVRFENGDEALCYPEEICRLNHKPVPVPKTFKTLRPGDILWLGCRKEDARTITSIDTTAHEGKTFVFKDRLMDDTPYEDDRTVGKSKLDRAEANVKGHEDSKFFASRKAALECEAHKYHHTVHCIEGEIDLLRQKAEKYRAKADELRKEAISCNE